MSLRFNPWVGHAALGEIHVFLSTLMYVVGTDTGLVKLQVVLLHS